MKCGDWRKDAKHRVVIQEKSLADDDYGGSAVTWNTISTVWAAIYPVNGREVYLQDQRQSKVNSKIVIRYISSIKKTSVAGACRVTFDGRTMPIVYIRNLDNDMKNEGKVFQELFVTENEAENG